MDDEEKEHLRVLLASLPAAAARFVLRDGRAIVGRVAREHNSNAVDAAGNWRIAAGVTLVLQDGSERTLDLLDVDSIQPLLAN